MAGLIERAVGRLGDGANVVPMDRSAPNGAVAKNQDAERQFDLPEDRLAGDGFFTLNAGRQDQVLELRAIKRSLLKRLGMMRRLGRDRGTTGESGRAGGRDRNVVLVTSTRPGEGKTFISANLALSFALEDHQPVLLIDGDAPRPKIRRVFGLDDGPGVTDHLAAGRSERAPGASSPIWRAMRDGAATPLQIMGEGRARADATQLFASEEGRRFFREAVANRPDRLILVDAPPLLATTETFALARHADEIVFVVQADATPEPAVALALEELLEINPNVSLVLNRCLIPAGGAHYGSYQQYDRINPGETADAPTDGASAKG